MIYYFDNPEQVNLDNVPQINEVRPLKQVLTKYTNSNIEVRYTTDYTEPGLYPVEVSLLTHQWTNQPNTHKSFNVLTHIRHDVIKATREKRLRILLISVVEGDTFLKDDKIIGS